MEKQFYVGQVVEPEDLFFRDEFIDELWKSLKRQHVILSAPRRTGKTSVMTHLLNKPKKDWIVLYLNVQDISHPEDLYLQLLDEFNTRDPRLLRRLFSRGGSLVGEALSRIDSVEINSVKVAIRESDKELSKKWKERLDDLLQRIRETNCHVLIILDELPDMLLAMKKKDHGLLREFLAWHRKQRTEPMPSRDSVRWLIGGSINLLSTLDSIGMVDLMNDPQVVPLPVFSDKQVVEFVNVMLKSHTCVFQEGVPEEVARRLGRPILYFLQMATQELSRKWRRESKELCANDVEEVFRNLITSTEARDKLQHYYSRIAYYYETAAEPAYELLRLLCLSEEGLPREALLQKYRELRYNAGDVLLKYEVDREFNGLMLHLQNDFYVEEITDGIYDFTSGLLKAWWRKYYA